MRLTLSVKIPDGTDLDDVSVAIRSSFGRAAAEDRTDGRIRDENGNTLGAWSIDDVDDIAAHATIPYREGLMFDDVNAALILENRSVEITVAVGLDAAHPDAGPTDGFASFRIPAAAAARIGRSLVAWTAVR